MQETETTQSRSQARRIAAQRGEDAPDFTPESSAATTAEQPYPTLEEKDAVRDAAQAAERAKQRQGMVMNRHERRKAAKLNRQERGRH